MITALAKNRDPLPSYLNAIQGEELLATTLLVQFPSLDKKIEAMKPGSHLLFPRLTGADIKLHIFRFLDAKDFEKVSLQIMKNPKNLEICRANQKG